jgi:hypothetical protein
MKKHKNVKGILYRNGISGDNLQYVEIQGGYEPWFVSYTSGTSYMIGLYSNTPETLQTLTGDTSITTPDSGETYFGADKSTTIVVNTYPILKNDSGKVSISGNTVDIGSSITFEGDDDIYTYLGEDSNYLIWRIVNIQSTGSTVPTLNSIVITGSTLVTNGLTTVYTVQGVYDTGDVENVTDDVYFTVTNGTGAATISQQGTLTPSSAGTVTINASYQKVDGNLVTDTYNVTVDALNSITIAGDASVITGDTAVYTATGVYNSGSKDISSLVTWSTTDGTGTAVIDATGTLTGSTAGTVSVDATYLYVDGTLAVTITS